MTSLEAYKKFLLKLNKNDTNTKIKVSKGEFVLIFNEQKRKWLDDVLVELQSSELINELSEIYELDTKLNLLESKEDFDIFKLPANFERQASSYTVAEKDGCLRKLYNWPKKPKNRNAILQNSNHQPDFDFEQTITEQSNNSLIVFKKDFEIKEQYLSYYRLPNDIDLDGYIKINGERSQNIDPDIPDKLVDQIIDRCVIEASLNYENVEQFQMAQTRK